MDSEASTCSADSMNEEDSLKVQLQKERKKSAEKDEQIRWLQTKVKLLEAELAKARVKSENASGETAGFAKVQKELLDELQKRKAVQYELICTGQQVCELQEKLNEQEKVIREMAGPSKSPPSQQRSLSSQQTPRAPSSSGKPSPPSTFKVAASRHGSKDFTLPPAAVASQVPGEIPSPLFASPVSTASPMAASPSSTGYFAPPYPASAPVTPVLTARGATSTPRGLAASHTSLDGTWTPRVPRVSAPLEMARMSSFTAGITNDPSRSRRNSFGNRSGASVRMFTPTPSAGMISPNLWMPPAGQAATICAPPGGSRELTFF